jgi:hypothetical protein
MRKLVMIAALLSAVSGLLVSWIPEFSVEAEPGYRRSEGVYELAQALLERGLPVGIVVSERALQPVYPPDQRTSAAAMVEDLLADFNARHPLMQAVQRNGVVRIASRNVPAVVREALSRPRHLPQPVTAGGINVMFYTVAAMLRGSRTNGIVGVGPLPGPECGVDGEVRLRAGATTVAEIGDEVVRQLSGTGWLITFNEARPATGLQVGILCADGWWQIALDPEPLAVQP